MNPSTSSPTSTGSDAGGGGGLGSGARFSCISRHLRWFSVSPRFSNSRFAATAAAADAAALASAWSILAGPLLSLAVSRTFSEGISSTSGFSSSVSSSASSVTLGSVNRRGGSTLAGFTGSVTSNLLEVLSNFALPSSPSTSNGSGMSRRYFPGTWKKSLVSLTSSSAPAIDSSLGVSTLTTRCLGRLSRRLDTSLDELPRPNPLDKSPPSSLCTTVCLGSHSPSGSFAAAVPAAGRFTALSKLNGLGFDCDASLPGPLGGSPAGDPLGAILPPGVTLPSPGLSPLLSALSLMACTPGPLLGPMNVFLGRVYRSGHFRS